MKSRNETDFEQLPSDLMLKINQLCDQFESELRQGKLPSISAYLDELALEYRDVVLKELIPLEVEHLSRDGNPPEAGDYLIQFPVLDQEWLSALIANARAGTRTAAARNKHNVNQDHSHIYSLEECHAWLTETGILAQRELDEWLQSLDESQRPATAAALSERLFEAGKLTRYQADVLINGETQPLRFGEYLIQEPIGSGGMGTVYKAIHKRMKRTVALKVIRTDMEHVPDRLKRFEREVQTAARLSHPNIVTAYDAGEEQGIHYLICEYIDGESLSQLVRDAGPLDFSDALNCILQVAHGLGYAHSRGVIHRDIKPANILVDDQGDLKILDMGLARLQQSAEDLLASDSQTQLTTSQFFMGTIDYMAPEQARNTRLADHRSDIYSLGCTFHFLLTAKPVYNGETTVERILAHKEQPIPRLSTLGLQIPREFDSIFEKMLAKDPADRYASVKDLINDLEKFSAENLQDRTLTLPVGEGQTRKPAQENWASAPTEVQPAVSEYTVMAASTLEENRKTGTQNYRGLIWAVIAITVAMLIGIIFWNSADQNLNPANSGVAEQNSISIPGLASATNAKQIQAEYAQKMHLPVSESVTLDIQGDDSQLELMLIPPGEFEMGNGSPSQAAADAPAHHVKLTRPYYISSTEITNQLFRSFVNETKYETDAERTGGFGMSGGSWGKSPEYSWKNLGELPVRDQAPAVNISWNDATAFCNWLSKKTGEVYRLPTEAEWEYACRAGSPTGWFFGPQSDEMENYAWFLNNSEGRVYPTKQKRPNAYGLYDMYGNEWEWCQDFYGENYYTQSPSENPTGPKQGSERVQRGGGFQQSAEQLTSYLRGHGTPQSPSRGAFRIVREVKRN